MNSVPFLPESAPFSADQRAWLNGFLAGLHSAAPVETAPVVPQNTEPLLILFGSQTGSAEGLAKKVAKESQARGFRPTVLPLNDFAQANLSAGPKTLIISSTWGDGEPPDNAAKFWAWLNAESAPRMENLPFAVLGLGDKNYSDFCGSAKKFDLRLEALGARRLQPRGECDTDYEAAAKTWIEDLWSKLGAGGGALSMAVGSPVNGQSALALPGGTGQEAVPAAMVGYDKAHPFPARLLKNSLLNLPGSGKEVRHFEIALGGSGLSYHVGDALGVIPENCPKLVGAVLAVIHATGDEPVTVAKGIVPLREALTQVFDLARPSTELLAEIARRAPEGELAVMLAPDRTGDLKKWLFGRDVLDVLSGVMKPLKSSELLPLLRLLSPRLYSISSSPKAHPGEVHLTVGTVRYETFGRKRKGVASTFLSDLAGPATPVRIFVQPAHGFKPPANGDTPMIMVGPGTGIAPFRAFLEERAISGATGKNWLFFGDQKRSADFLYEEQLTAWQQSGFLTRLDLAFSRDQTDKIYVQTRMLESADELWSWLEAGAHFYVCGDASRMAKDVDAALHQAIVTAGGKSPDEAKAYVEKMKTEKRYQRDVY